MKTLTVTFTITELCSHSGVSQEELLEIVGLGMIEPAERQKEPWQFDDHALAVVNRALRLRRELELDWPGIAMTLSLMEENQRLLDENRRLAHRLARFIR